MTPQLQQAIKLLQLSNLELAAEVDRELAQNPLLDRAESANDTLLAGPSADQRDTVGDSLGKEDAAGGEAASEAEAAEAAVGRAAVLDRSPTETLPSASDEPLDTDSDTVYTKGAAG